MELSKVVIAATVVTALVPATGVLGAARGLWL